MVQLKNKKLASMGPDVVIIIPRSYIKNDLLDPDKTYDITIEEAREKKNKKNGGQ